jgi:16S rRNA (guanine527-N7)-methyltransferase
VSALPRGLFTTTLPGLGRPLTDGEGTLIDKYLKLLIKWQKSHRLVGSTNRDWMIENVVIDSLAFLAMFPDETRTVADIGSGAGVPGVPIAIVRPDLRMTLIDARRRRVSFLTTVVRELELTRVEVVDGRIETLGSSLGGRFDVAVMRCVAAPDAIVSPALDLIRPAGALIVSAGPKMVSTTGTTVVELPGGRQRHFLVVRQPRTA